MAKHNAARHSPTWLRGGIALLVCGCWPLGIVLAAIGKPGPAELAWPLAATSAVAMGFVFVPITGGHVSACVGRWLDHRKRR